MHIAEFQQWLRKRDRESQWDLQTSLQIVAHLTEEVGELVQSINRIIRKTGSREDHITNLGVELVDVFWLLTTIANKFEINLDEQVHAFVERVEERPIEFYRHELLAGLQSVDQELSTAKDEIDLEEE